MPLLVFAWAPVAAWLLAPPLFARSPDAPQLAWADYLLAALYGMLLLAVALMTLVRDLAPARWLPTQLPTRLYILVQPLFGQPLAAWLLALPVVVGVAVVLTSRLLPPSEMQWVRVLVDGPDSSTPPGMSLHTGDDDAAISWQPDVSTALALLPREAERPIVLARLNADGGAVDLAAVERSGGEVRSEGLVIADPGGALLRWAAPSRNIHLTLAAESGAALARWHDQEVVVEPGGSAELRLPAMFQGWALIDPATVRRLTFEVAEGAGQFEIKAIEVLGDRPVDVRLTAAKVEGCARLADGGALVLEAASDRSCRVSVALPRLVDETAGVVRALAVIGLTIAGLAALGALGYGARWLQRRWPSLVEVRDVASVEVPAGLGRAMALVFTVACGYHLTFALTMPLFFTNDSIDYYSVARRFIELPWLSSSIGSVRTPGYPAFIALVIAAFGDTVIHVVVLQHLALALLAPLTTWVLARHMPLRFAAVIGLAAGLSPAVTPTANIVWTESLTAASGAAAIALLLRARGVSRLYLAIGGLAGAAAMIRPNALILVAVVVGWLLLSGWCSAQIAGKRLAVAQAALVVCGYLTIAAPWHLHLARVRVTLDPSLGHATFTAWVVGVSSRWISADLPANLPHRAVWSVPSAWGNHNPWALVNVYREMFPEFVRSGAYLDWIRIAMVQGHRIYPELYRDNLAAALWYYLTLSTLPDYRFYLKTPVRYYVSELQILQPPEFTGEFTGSSDYASIEQLLRRLSYRWQPAEGALVQTVLRTLSRRTLDAWSWLTTAALLSVVPLMIDAQWRRVMAGWLYWIAIIASYTMICLVADRYILITEPVLYIIVGCGVYSLTRIAHRLRGSS